MAVKQKNPHDGKKPKRSPDNFPNPFKKTKGLPDNPWKKQGKKPKYSL
jgi:hypothetical protein